MVYIHTRLHTIIQTVRLFYQFKTEIKQILLRFAAFFI